MSILVEDVLQEDHYDINGRDDIDDQQGPLECQENRIVVGHDLWRGIEMLVSYVISRSEVDWLDSLLRWTDCCPRLLSVARPADSLLVSSPLQEWMNQWRIFFCRSSGGLKLFLIARKRLLLHFHCEGSHLKRAVSKNKKIPSLLLFSPSLSSLFPLPYLRMFITERESTGNTPKAIEHSLIMNLKYRFCSLHAILNKDKREKKILQDHKKRHRVSSLFSRELRGFKQSSGNLHWLSFCLTDFILFRTFRELLREISSFTSNTSCTNKQTNAILYKEDSSNSVFSCFCFNPLTALFHSLLVMISLYWKEVSRLFTMNMLPPVIVMTPGAVKIEKKETFDKNLLVTN